MRIFVTGATGFVGSAVVRELLGAGYQVLGLVRSDTGAKSLAAAGAEVHRGDLQDLESLRTGAAQSDGVIHTAFVHDFTRFAEVSDIDKRAIETLGSVFAGSERPLIVSSGLAVLAQGDLATEDDPPVPVSAEFPRASEHTAVALVKSGVRAMVVRLPQVHDTTKQGLITYMIQIAREKGLSAYVGEGLTRWAAVHVNDAASVYRLALEKGHAGARYHAVAEEGVLVREIADAIGRSLNVPVVSKSPEEAKVHFGWLTKFVNLDLAGSSTLTRKRLRWKPSGPTLLADLENMNSQPAIPEATR